MAKKIINAFIQQTLQFDSEEEYQNYRTELRNGKTAYFIVEVARTDEGPVFCTVRKQYNKNAFPGGERGVKNDI